MSVLYWVYMETEKYSALLQGELDAVTKELQTLGVLNPKNAQDWVPTSVDTDEGEADENVSADRAEALEERTATLADFEARYNAVRSALERISAGTYGACEVCGEAIEEERLLANPSARTCKAHREEEADLPS